MDRSWHASQLIKPLKDGRMRMMLAVADTRELLGWILSFRGGVKVLRPESLGRAVKEEERRIGRN